MRGAILLSFGAFFCGLAGVSKATTCTSATLSTCEKSLYMTGKCVDGVCECISSDYTPGPFGCQKRQKADIIIDYITIETMMNPDAMVLKCSDGIGLTTYKWFKDGKVLEETSDRLRLVEEAYGGSYTCQSSIAGVLSEESDPFKATVASGANIKPEVKGMSNRLIVMSSIVFTCHTDRHIRGEVFFWTIDGRHEMRPNLTPRYVHTVQKKDGGKKIKCSISIPGTQNFFHSEEVAFPAKIEEDIDGVELVPTSATVISGEHLQLRCRPTGGFPEPEISDYSLTYLWESIGPDGNELPLPFSRQRTLDIVPRSTSSMEGNKYTCKAKARVSTSYKTSNTLTVTVKDTMGPTHLISSALGPLMRGYFSLTCDYDTINTFLPVTYKWFKDGDELKGVTDKILQFNEATMKDLNGQYKCQITGEDGSVSTSYRTVLFEHSSEISKSNDMSWNFHTPLIGETLDLVCFTAYDTPGGVYHWIVDNVKQPEVGKTFKYTAKTIDEVTVQCGYTFDGYRSKTLTVKVNAYYIRNVAVSIHNDPYRIGGPNFNNWGTYFRMYPVKGSKFKLACDLDKVEGAGRVTYQWIKGESVLAQETSKEFEIQIGSEPVTVQCNATARSQTVSSSIVILVPSDRPKAPALIFVGNSEPLLKGKIAMHCSSESYSEGAKFVWTKDGNIIQGVTSYKYSINEITESDNGDYTCKITVVGKTSETSLPLRLYAESDRHSCLFASNCREYKNMNGTICEDKHCKCLPGHPMMRGECTGDDVVAGVTDGGVVAGFTAGGVVAGATDGGDGDAVGDGDGGGAAAAVTGSLLMIACTFLTHKAF